MGEKQNTPERIWTYGSMKNGKQIAYTNPSRWVGSLQPTTGWTEYVRADLVQQPTSQRCGECGHSDGVDGSGICKNADYGIGCCLCRCVFPATGGPGDELISRKAAMSAICYMCAKSEQYGPPKPLEGSVRLFHFQGADNWNAGQCFAQPILNIPVATTGAGGTERKQPTLPLATGWQSCGVRYNDSRMVEIKFETPQTAEAFVDALELGKLIASPAPVAEGQPHDHDWYNDGDVMRCYDCTATESVTPVPPPAETKLAPPSDVDSLLFRVAAKDCEHLAAGMRDCPEELPFADWCVVCQARGLIQKYSRPSTATPGEGARCTRCGHKFCSLCMVSCCECDADFPVTTTGETAREAQNIADYGRVEAAAKAVVDEIWGEAVKLAQSFVNANVRNYNDHKGVESLECIYDAKRDTAQQIVNQMKNFNEARWHKPKSVIAILSRHFSPTEATQVAVEAAATELVDELFQHGDSLTPTVKGDPVAASYSPNYVIQKATAIISKHCSDAGEVERLRSELKREQKDHELTVDVFRQVERIWEQKTTEEVIEARANAIRECVKSIEETRVNAIGAEEVKRSFVASLESLAKEGGLR